MKISRGEFIAILQENANGMRVESLEKSQRLVDLGVDSLGFATLLFAIEDKLGVQVDEAQLEGLNGESTLQDLTVAFERLGYQIEV